MQTVKEAMDVVAGQALRQASQARHALADLLEQAQALPAEHRTLAMCEAIHRAKKVLGIEG